MKTNSNNMNGIGDHHPVGGHVALTVVITRTSWTTERSATMAYYSSLVYLVAAFLLSPLAVAFGEMPDAQPSLAFLFHAWAMPAPLDLAIMAGVGLVWAGWMYFMTRAYSTAPPQSLSRLNMPLYRTMCCRPLSSVRKSRP